MSQNRISDNVYSIVRQYRIHRVPKHVVEQKTLPGRENRSSMRNVNPNIHPCLTCGACCAFYRASFYWAEADDVEGGTVPAYLTEKLNDFCRMMKGTSGSTPRCIALQGAIGEHVYCSIYPLRASVCREFPVAWELGLPNERCDKARMAWGLHPLEPNTWNWSDDLRRAA